MCADEVGQVGNLVSDAKAVFGALQFLCYWIQTVVEVLFNALPCGQTIGNSLSDSLVCGDEYSIVVVVEELYVVVNSIVVHEGHVLVDCLGQSCLTL